MKDVKNDEKKEAKKIEKRHALVTGGAGFIGSHLVEGLLAQGWEVTVIDDLSSGKLKNLAAVKKDITFVKGDVNDASSLKKALKDVNYVFHLAAIPSVPGSIAEPRRFHDANLNATLSLLLAAKRSGVKRIVYTSSAAIYGDSPALPTREDAAPVPISPYATQKLASEQYVLEFDRYHNLEGVVLRYFNVYGPRQDPKSAYAGVMPIFVSKMKAGKAPTIYGNGNSTRDYVYVTDVVAANILAATTPEARGQAFNVATGKKTKIKDVVIAINKALTTKIDPIYGAPRAGDIVHSLADISHISNVLKYQPRVSFTEGIARTVASM